MTASTLSICADGGAGIGAGHVMRSLALADAWRAAGGGVRWFAQSLAPRLVDLIRARGIAIDRLAPGHSYRPLIEFAGAQTDGWVELDGYHLGEGQAPLRRAGVRLLVVDDDARWPLYDCDVLLNQNPRAGRLQYNTTPDTTRLLGSSFALLRNEFRRAGLARRVAGRPVRQVLVSFGGDDAHGQAARVSAILARSHPELTVTTASGFIAGEGSSDLSHLMAAADVAIVAAGTVCWELAHLGVPFIAMTVADNQIDIARGVQEAGIGYSLGSVNDVDDRQLLAAIDRMIDDPNRAAMSARGQAMIDGEGGTRVVAVLHHASTVGARRS